MIFSSEMVRAILDGRKTQTRRVIKPQPEIAPGIGHVWKGSDSIQEWTEMGKWKKGQTLWVRESWHQHYLPDNSPLGGRPCYAADQKCSDTVIKWKPSIFMPRWASRITLKIEGVRVEHVQDISIEDIKAEGIEECTDIGWRYCWGQLWNKINEKRGYGWDINPWVFAILFKQIKGNG